MTGILKPAAHAYFKRPKLNSRENVSLATNSVMM
jgi:hypothetical protein